MAVGPDGSLYFADQGNNRIRRVGPDGVITTVAGGGDGHWEGIYHSDGDGAPATDAILDEPTDVAVGPDGSLYFADSGHNRIRRVDSEGIISTVAGRIFIFTPGDNYASRVTAARPATPCSPISTGVELGPDGSLYIADQGNILGSGEWARTGLSSPSWGQGFETSPATAARPAAHRSICHRAWRWERTAHFTWPIR